MHNSRNDQCEDVFFFKRKRERVQFPLVDHHENHISLLFYKRYFTKRRHPRNSNVDIERDQIDRERETQVHVIKMTLTMQRASSFLSIST